MTRLYSCVLVVAALIAAPERTACAQPVTVEQLVTAALDRAPDIQAARADIDVARGRLTQAALRPNPMVTGTQRTQVAGRDYQLGVGLEWPLDLLRRTPRVNTARQEVEVVRAAVSDRERLLAAAVRTQAGEFLAATRAVRVLDDVLGVARQVRDLLDSRVMEGAAPRVDANMARVEVGRLEAERAVAAGEAEAAAIELKRLCGLPPEAPLALSESLEALVGAAASGQTTPALAAPKGPRPDIREASLRVQLADARIEETRREGTLNMTLLAGVDRMRFGFPQLGLDQHGSPTAIESVTHSITIGAALELPWRNRNEGNVAATRAEKAGAVATLMSRELAAQAEIASARAREREARRAADYYSADIRDLARQNTDILIESYRLGRAPLSDVLVEQRRYLDVEAAYTSVLARAYQAGVALRTALGELP